MTSNMDTKCSCVNLFLKCFKCNIFFIILEWSPRFKKNHFGVWSYQKSMPKYHITSHVYDKHLKGFGFSPSLFFCEQIMLECIQATLNSYNRISFRRQNIVILTKIMPYKIGKLGLSRIETNCVKVIYDTISKTVITAYPIKWVKTKGKIPSKKKTVS